MNILSYLPTDVDTIAYKTEEEWHTERQKGVGGSDVGVIMGLNKYKSLLRLYREKTEGLKTDLSNNVFVKKGKDLEDLIRIKYVLPYMKDKGYDVHTIGEILTNRRVPYIRANLDAFAIPRDWKGNPEDNIVIEIKWVSDYASVNWDGEEFFGIPGSYYAQVQAYMAVTGASKAVVCALFDEDWTPKFYEIPRDNNFINSMISSVKTFIEAYVIMGLVPQVDSELDKDYITESLKTPVTQTTPSDDMNDLVAKFRELKTNLKALENETSEVLSEITDMYLKGLRPSSPLFNVKISVCKSTRFDSAKFKEDHPDMYKEYLKESEYSRTTIK